MKRLPLLLRLAYLAARAQAPAATPSSPLQQTTCSCGRPQLTKRTQKALLRCQSRLLSAHATPLSVSWQLTVSRSRWAGLGAQPLALPAHVLLAAAVQAGLSRLPMLRLLLAKLLRCLAKQRLPRLLQACVLCLQLAAAPPRLVPLRLLQEGGGVHTPGAALHLSLVVVLAALVLLQQQEQARVGQGSLLFLPAPPPALALPAQGRLRRRLPTLRRLTRRTWASATTTVKPLALLTVALPALPLSSLGCPRQRLDGGGGAGGR